MAGRSGGSWRSSGWRAEGLFVRCRKKKRSRRQEEEGEEKRKEKEKEKKKNKYEKILKISQKI